jgi:hypothetical protein
MTLLMKHHMLKHTGCTGFVEPSMLFAYTTMSQGVAKAGVGNARV